MVDRSVIDEFIRKDRFREVLGVEITEVGQGYARGKMTITPEHLNSAGTVHGGAIFGFADALFSVASNSHGSLAMAINVSISYFKAVREGTLYAEVKQVSLNPKLGTYLITITDQDNNTVALFQGTVYRKQTPLEDVIRS